MICMTLIARIAFSGEGSDSAVGAGIAQQKGKRMAEPASKATAPTKKARAVADTPKVLTPCTPVNRAGLQSVRAAGTPRCLLRASRIPCHLRCDMLMLLHTQRCMKQMAA